jgi:nitroreductase
MTGAICLSQVLEVDLLEAIKGRRSIRSFKSDEVTQREVDLLIEAATHAPSAGNIQPWEFTIIKTPEMKKRLVEAAYGQSFIEEASIVIVVCANEDRSSQRYGDRGKTLYCLQDSAAAIQNMLLTAYSLGLGSCWIGAFKEDEVRAVLNVPAGVKPVAMIPIGHPARIASSRQKRTMEQIVHYEKY